MASVVHQGRAGAVLGIKNARHHQGVIGRLIRMPSGQDALRVAWVGKIPVSGKLAGSGVK
ncbi:MAG: hypothetical protein QMB90_01475 [Rubritalea sp.]